MLCCHACGADLGRPERVGRRDTCLRCGAELHCCLNCRHYAPGQHNDCMETQAERMVDKARSNFCDYFALRDAVPKTAATPNPRARLEALFKRPV